MNDSTIINHEEQIVGYKAFKKDEKGYFTDGLGKSDRIYFEEGKTYETKGDPILCFNGLHFFRHYCFALDFFEAGCMIAKVKSLGKVQEDTEKCVTNKLQILSIEYEEELDGHRNSGNWNSGDWYINYFCTETRFFMFDKECSREYIKDIDMSWFDLTDKTYKEEWSQCPEKVLREIKMLKHFNANKFFEITGIKIT